MDTFSIVSLGCSKNTSDSNRIIQVMRAGGFEFLPDPASAPSLVLVNSCAFTMDARRATADVIKSFANARDASRPRVVLLGCLAADPRSPADAGSAPLDVIDAAVGFEDYLKLPRICRELLGRPSAEDIASSCDDVDRDASYRKFLQVMPGRRIEMAHTAYLKIAEGCSLGCAFCSIPLFRGRQESRPIDEIVVEARLLGAQGVVELNLIAQELLSYGRDLYLRPKLTRLLDALLEIESFKWIRLNYCHPKFLKDDLLELMAREERIVPYFDIPLQHIDDSLLASMGRGYRRAEVESLLDRIRVRVPNAQIITSFIVGFPGESESAFREIEAFVRAGHFRYVNCFSYSHEPGTRAYEFVDTVPTEIKHQRATAIRAAQREVFRGLAARTEGMVLRVLVDGANRDFRFRSAFPYVGRTPWDSLEDSEIVLCSKDALRPGEFRDVRVVGSEGYTLFGQVQ